LSGLSYFHENKNILTKIIKAYTEACNKENDIKTFKDICFDFINDTSPDGYDALIELKLMFKDNKQKLLALDEINETMQEQNEVIKF